MPRPEKHVLVCTQNRPPNHPRGSCGAHQSSDVMAEFMNEIQRLNLFDKIMLTNTGCIGPCQLGANVLVYPDGILYNKVSKADVKTIIQQHLLGGTPVTELIAPKEVW